MKEEYGCPFNTNSHPHTPTVCTHKPSTSTHIHTPPQCFKEVNRRVWHPLASCAWNAAEKKLNKLWLWQRLKWGDITQVSFDFQVKAICDTILDYSCLIEDNFDVIIRKNNLNVQHESWTEFNTEEITIRRLKTASREPVFIRYNLRTSQKHHTHTFTLTHLRKRSRVSGCASKIASDTKNALVPKEGGGAS